MSVVPPVADPATPAPAPSPTVPAPAPTPGPTPPSDPEDGEEDDLTPQQRATRSRRRMETRLDAWKARAGAAETERDALKSRIGQLEAQNGSVTQLRASLLSTAIRGEAATLVLPEALDDAVKLLDVSDLKVGDDGTVDSAKVKAKLEELVKSKPYLAARQGNQPQPLPGGHQPAPTLGGHEGFNRLVRQAAGRE